MNRDNVTEKILIVDDESSILDLFSIWLEEMGYVCKGASNAKEAIQYLDEEPFALVISDINMPGMTGIELLGHVKSCYQDEKAVLLVTAIHDRELAIQALRMGAYGYLTKPVDQNEMIVNVVDALERRRLVLLSNSYQKSLEAEVRKQTEAIRMREEEISLRLIAAAEYRDDETGEHIRRMGLIATELAKSAGMAMTDVDNLRIAAPMHDIGKIGVPDHILRKPGKLTVEEFAIIKRHTIIGAKILDGSDIPLLQMGREIAMYHHEWWNGNGYPEGLKEEEIPLCARIVSIADVYDALLSPRVYKPAFSEEVALEMMIKERGTHFDPTLFDLFLSILPKISALRDSV
ncbi:MAG: response regulator [bacterium]|jgi:putative two-component system response regulator|nr:response regulator [bacterium]